MWRLLHWKPEKQVRLLKCVKTVGNLANFVDSLFIQRIVQMVKMGMLVPTLLHWPLESQQDKEVLICV